MDSQSFTQHRADAETAALSYETAFSKIIGSFLDSLKNCSHQGKVESEEFQSHLAAIDCLARITPRQPTIGAAAFDLYDRTIPFSTSSCNHLFSPNSSAEVVPVIGYNIALAYHIQAMSATGSTVKDENLRVALGFYDMALADCFRDGQVVCAHLQLLLGLINNKAHVHSMLFQHEATLECLRWLYCMLEAPETILRITPEDHHLFYYNATVSYEMCSQLAAPMA